MIKYIGRLQVLEANAQLRHHNYQLKCIYITLSTECSSVV